MHIEIMVNALEKLKKVGLRKILIDRNNSSHCDIYNFNKKKKIMYTVVHTPIKLQRIQ